ncbi:unnamed protein product [Notodromas monacha]|uniref:Uncharacterized protein n=1 Tax=Notodromas monacha TaxID=399045 RepID=A0A7R9BJK6_9CRUS|nr:unnamed protein product [Notodromas monacha]CAG0915558.1 unnamed protein product [Notodromas monacha]
MDVVHSEASTRLVFRCRRRQEIRIDSEQAWKMAEHDRVDVKLERVLGLTSTSNSSLALDAKTGCIAYGAGVGEGSRETKEKTRPTKTCQKLFV